MLLRECCDKSYARYTLDMLDLLLFGFDLLVKIVDVFGLEVRKCYDSTAIRDYMYGCSIGFSRSKRLNTTKGPSKINVLVWLEGLCSMCHEDSGCFYQMLISNTTPKDRLRELLRWLLTSGDLPSIDKRSPVGTTKNIKKPHEHGDQDLKALKALKSMNTSINKGCQMAWHQTGADPLRFPPAWCCGCCGFGAEEPRMARACPSCSGRVSNLPDPWLLRIWDGLFGGLTGCPKLLSAGSSYNCVLDCSGTYY